MKLIGKVYRALVSAVDSVGGIKRFAELTGVSTSCVSRWYNKITTEIESDNWDKIKDKLYPYISDKDLDPFDENKKTIKCHLTDQNRCPFQDDGIRKAIFMAMDGMNDSQLGQVFSAIAQIKESEKIPHPKTA